jgi:hypothetical protein
MLLHSSVATPWAGERLTQQKKGEGDETSIEIRAFLMN